jgi:hypothetical protein
VSGGGTGTVDQAPDPGRLRGLRANSFAAIVFLLVEYGLGVWVNLYGHLPASDHGAGLAGGVGRAVANGPVGLSIHAVLGVTLIVTAAAAVVRAILTRRRVLIAASAAGLVAVVTAGVSGARFVGQGTTATSMSMAVAAGVAIGAFALTLLLCPSAPAVRPGRSPS